MTLMEQYKRANEALHPTGKAAEGALSGAAKPRSRRPLRAVIPAGIAAALAVVLLVTGVPGLGGGGAHLPRPAPHAHGAAEWRRCRLGAVQ